MHGRSSGPLRKSCGHSWDVELADQAVFGLTHRTASPQVRVRDGFVEGKEWGARNAGGFQRGDRGLAVRKCPQPFFDDNFERLVVVAACARAVETGIVGQPRHFHGLNHLLPLMRHNHNGDELFALVTKDASGSTARMERPGSFWRERWPA